jgi:hypothetical protein
MSAKPYTWKVLSVDLPGDKVGDSTVLENLLNTQTPFDYEVFDIILDRPSPAVSSLPSIGDTTIVNYKIFFRKEL